MYVNAVYNNAEHHSGSSLALASFFFAFQIYGDFAGYSLIAIGTARIMGFRLMTNFNRPYFATNIGTFWSRWHISLSTWFKDYLYIPLGGNRVSKGRNYFNLFITFFISGIWHGANFTFMIWGALHGFYLVVEKYLGLAKEKEKSSLGIRNGLKILLTFILVNFAWIFFRANSLSDAWVIISKIFTEINTPLFTRWEVFAGATIALIIFFVKEISEEFLPQKFSFPDNSLTWVRLSAYTLLISVIILFGVFDSSSFIYFQF